MLAHVPSFGRNPRGSADFLAYPVPKACLHVLGTRVPRRLGVARSASSPSAGLRMQPYPRSPDLVWPGHLHGRGCLSARAVGNGFPTVGLRLWLGPGRGWLWVLFTPARRGWGLGWVCLGSVCDVVPLLPAVCGVRGWALVWACFRFPCPPPFPVPVCGVGVRAGPGSQLCPALLGWVVGVCFLRFFFGLVVSVGFFLSGCWVSLSRVLWSLPPSPFFRAGQLAFFFLCVSACFGAWLGVAVFGWVVPLCLFGGPVFGALWVGGLATFCVVGERFGGCGLFSRGQPLHPPPFFFSCPVAGVWCGWSLATPGGGSCVLLPATPGWVSLPVVVGGPRHSWLGSVGGVAVWCVVCGGGVLVGLWLVCDVVGPSPLLAEVPVCYSPPLLAGFHCRWWWAVPATPGWGPLAALLSGVWCVAVVCWWGCLLAVTALTFTART